MLQDLYSKLEGVTISPGTQAIAAAIQEKAGFSVPDEVALIAALALTSEVHLQLSALRKLERGVPEVAELHDQISTIFRIAVDVVGVGHGLTQEQVDHLSEVAEQAAIGDLQKRSEQFDALHAAKPSLQ